MLVKIDNNEYEFIIASDVIRDGIGLEIRDKFTNSVIVEIFETTQKSGLISSQRKLISHWN